MKRHSTSGIVHKIASSRGYKVLNFFNIYNKMAKPVGPSAHAHTEHYIHVLSNQILGFTNYESTKCMKYSAM